MVFCSYIEKLAPSSEFLTHNLKLLLKKILSWCSYILIYFSLWNQYYAFFGGNYAIFGTWQNYFRRRLTWLVEMFHSAIKFFSLCCTETSTRSSDKMYHTCWNTKLLHNAYITNWKQLSNGQRILTKDIAMILNQNQRKINRETFELCFTFYHSSLSLF